MESFFRSSGFEKSELCHDDFELAIKDLVPSVSDEELMRYEKIKREFTKGKRDQTEMEGELELDGKLKTETSL